MNCVPQRPGKTLWSIFSADASSKGGHPFARTLRRGTPRDSTTATDQRRHEETRTVREKGWSRERGATSWQDPGLPNKRGTGGGGGCPSPLALTFSRKLEVVARSLELARLESSVSFFG